MKNIVTINCTLPTIDDFAAYTSEQSLLDHDIVLFDPCFPYQGRIAFNAGGSCRSIESGQALIQAIQHWQNEIKGALNAGKTIFFLLNRHETDSIATGSTSLRKGETGYDTREVSNYDVLPLDISVRNTKGRKFQARDPNFKDIGEALKDIVEYQVVVESKVTKKTFATSKGENIIGALLKLNNLSGHLVLLPYFDLSEMTQRVDENEIWTKEALKISKIVVSQLFAIDNSLKSKTNATPKPNWLERVTLPSQVVTMDEEIEKLEKEIGEIQKRIEEESKKKTKLLKYTNLIFENGVLLEDAIKDTLELIDYEVENFRDGDLEIDHIIVGPSKVRMIGEAEGKDTTAINISKFRQLESNINEDFEREQVEEPAKGILFGNGFRLTPPDQRKSQFTAKCLTNAKRLGTALIRTSDMYEVALHLLNHPLDTEFKAKCREAIESTKGEIVTFPVPDLASH